MRTRHMTGAGLFLTLVAVTTAAGQDLRRRIESGPDGQVALSFPARPDVCGSGSVLLRIGDGGFGDSWMWSRNDGFSGPCENGPVRALLTRAEGQVVAVRVAIGTVTWPAGATEIGTVTGADAARYFLDLARRTDGRLGREALLPAVMAEGAEVGAGLVELARSRTLSRGLRESAVSWLGRELARSGADGRGLATTLAALARDPNEPASLRTRAVTSLARAEVTGTTELLALAASDDPTIAKAAISGLSRSAEPRAREAIRRAARDQALPEPVRTEAIRALGGRDGTPADLAQVRALWPTITAGPTQEAILHLLGEAGGVDNTRWLLGVAGDDRQSGAVRARAIRAAEKAGVGSAELIELYDRGGDRSVRKAALEALFRIGDRTALDRALVVAKTDSDPQLRRVAVNWLGKSGDPRAREALADLVER